MTKSISEKIYVLRSELGLTRVEFSESLDMSINTLKAIEQKGVNPKSDILVSIAKKWPKYANWLLLGEGTLESLKELDNTLESYTVVDKADARFMEQCVINSNRLSKLIFIQSDGSEDLAALLLIDQPSLYEISDTPNCKGVVYVKSGNMNFTRTHGGGWLALREFRSWLEGKNSDLIYTSELFQMNQKVMDKVYRKLTISKDELMPAEKGERYKNFLSWKEGNGY